jgi:GNAT superfamily N-acetyltransferase
MTTADEAAAINTIVAAFEADPVTRWSWPDPQHYATGMPGLARAFGGRAFEHQGADCSDRYSGVALWLAPEIQPDEDALIDLIQRTVSQALRDDVFGLFEQMAAYHPDGPHWYLPLIGVDPAFQGQGHGSALMAYALERCDRDHVPAYLESTNPRNIPMYRRHGFEILGTIQVGSSPPMVPMLRPAR